MNSVVVWCQCASRAESARTRTAASESPLQRTRTRQTAAAVTVTVSAEEQSRPAAAASDGPGPAQLEDSDAPRDGSHAESLVQTPESAKWGEQLENFSHAVIVPLSVTRILLINVGGSLLTNSLFRAGNTPLRDIPPGARTLFFGRLSLI
jgi:hypothetical protein